MIQHAVFDQAQLQKEKCTGWRTARIWKTHMPGTHRPRGGCVGLHVEVSEMSFFRPSEWHFFDHFWLKIVFWKFTPFSKLPEMHLLSRNTQFYAICGPFTPCVGLYIFFGCFNMRFSAHSQCANFTSRCFDTSPTHDENQLGMFKRHYFVAQSAGYRLPDWEFGLFSKKKLEMTLYPWVSLAEITVFHWNSNILVVYNFLIVRGDTEIDIYVIGQVNNIGEVHYC